MSFNKLFDFPKYIFFKYGNEVYTKIIFIKLKYKARRSRIIESFKQLILFLFTILIYPLS